MGKDLLTSSKWGVRYGCKVQSEKLEVIGRRRAMMAKGKDTGDVMFLLGAGASVEAGVPSGDEITDMLLKFGSYRRTREGTDIENFLRFIQVRIANHLHVRTSEVNFEYILGVLE